MVKPLSFKGDKKPKKRKRPADNDPDGGGPSSSSVAARDDNAAAAEPDNDDSWVSAEAPADISGPVLIVLPTSKPSALACDAVGKVFAVPIENIVDGNPSSAEPHDVRQVWVANRVSGTESFRFKGHHGKYLSCSNIGQLSASADAVSSLESFNVVPAADGPAGVFHLQTLGDKYITVTDPSPSAKANAVAEIRGDAETAGSDASMLRIRMQARFKPRHKKTKEEKAQLHISRRELEETVGRRLDEDEVRVLKKARRQGTYHEALLDFKVKNKHDKFG